MADGQEIGPKEPDQVIEGEDLAGREPKESGRGEGELRSGWLGKVVATLPPFAIRKPVLLVIAALLLGGAGAWGFLGGPAWKGREPVRPSQTRETVPEDGLRQEELTRFYIPLPKDAPYRVMVIDWSVVWDGLSAVRFRKTEVVIRDRVYDSLTSLAAKEEGLNEELPIIEETISRALKDFLRNESVSVRVKEVKTY